MDITSPITSPSIFHYSHLPGIHYHFLPGHPYHHTINKGILIPSYWCSPVPHSVSQSHYCSIYLGVPLMLLSRKPHLLGSCKYPSVDINTSVLEDRPRVHVSWFHPPHWWVPWDTWKDSLVPFGLVVPHMLNFKSINTPLRFIQGIGSFIIWLKNPIFTQL